MFNESMQTNHEKEDEESDGTTSSEDQAASRLASHRQWLNVFTSPILNSINLNVQLAIKLRTSPALSQVPNRLYSSLKYQLIHNITMTPIARGVGDDDATETEADCSDQCLDPLAKFQILLATVQLIDTSSGRVVTLEPDHHVEPLKGSLKVVLTTTTTTTTNKNVVNNLLANTKTTTPSFLLHTYKFSGQNKVQFNRISSYRDKKQFQYRVQYFTPSNLEVPLLVMQSPAFYVYSRKPSINVDSTTMTSNNPTKRTKKPAAAPKLREVDSRNNSSNARIQLVTSNLGKRPRLITAVHYSAMSSSPTEGTSSNNTPMLVENEGETGTDAAATATATATNNKKPCKSNQSAMAVLSEVALALQEVQATQQMNHQQIHKLKSSHIRVLASDDQHHLSRVSPVVSKFLKRFNVLLANLQGFETDDKLSALYYASKSLVRAGPSTTTTTTTAF